MTSAAPHATKPSIEAMLRRHPVFQDASVQALGALAQSGRINLLRSGQCLLLAGHAAGTVNVVLDGVLRMYFPASKSRGELTVKLFSGPAVVGDAESLPGGAWLVSVQALTDVVAISFPLTSYLQALSRDPVACYQQYLECVARSRETYAFEQAMSGASAKEKLVALLVGYASHFGREVPDGTLIDFPLTQFDLAEQCASNRREVVRCLGDFYRAGALQRIGRRYVLVDREKLLAFQRGAAAALRGQG